MNDETMSGLDVLLNEFDATENESTPELEAAVPVVTENLPEQNEDPRLDELAQQVAQQAVELEKVNATLNPPPEPEALPPIPPITEFLGDFSDEAIEKGTAKYEALVNERAELNAQKLIEEKTKPVLEQAAQQAQNAHYDAINAKHPDAEEVFSSDGFKAWIEAQPSFAKGAITAALESGTAKEIIEVFDVFKAAKPADQNLEAAKANALKQVEKLKQQPVVPETLSAIPGGLPKATNPIEAIDSLSPIEQLAALQDMNEDQIKQWRGW